MNKEIEELYGGIANQANKVVPVKWNKIILNSEVDEVSANSCYYFLEEKSKKWVNFGEIPDKYNVSGDLCDKYTRELHDLIFELNELSKN